MGEGAVIAWGRDAEIVDLGDGRVLRRPRQRRSLRSEAELMRHVRAAGYPVPEVLEVRPDGIVLERVSGRSMLDDLAAHPWRVRRHARSLAALHRDLHRIPALEKTPAPYRPPLGDDVVVHADLHPGNVLVTPGGLYVIDWSNAGRGPGAGDVAEAWLLLAAGKVEGSPMLRGLAAALRGRFLAWFLREAGRQEARRWLWHVVERRSRDPRLSPAEKATMARVARTHATD